MKTAYLLAATIFFSVLALNISLPAVLLGFMALSVRFVGAGSTDIDKRRKAAVA